MLSASCHLWDYSVIIFRFWGLNYNTGIYIFKTGLLIIVKDIATGSEVVSKSLGLICLFLDLLGVGRVSSEQ